jgi:molybdenum cofactor cytidylyltransferase
MRLLSVDPSVATTDLPVDAIVCHDVRNPADRNEILVRKGSSLQTEALTELLGRGVAELHLAIAEPDDVAEDEAAARLAAAIVGAGASVAEARFGQVSLVSRARGMLRVERASLEQLNALDGVLLLTAEADRPVDADTTLGVVKCAPLFMPEATLQAAERIASASGPVLQVLPFEARRVAFLAPAERLRGGAFERAHSALSDAIAWYGSTLDQAIGTEATVEGLAAAYHTLRHSGAELILAAGASGTDPLDVVFEGLRRAGGDVLQWGIPAEPGTACWIGRLEAVPVLGLASCELFGQPGALDLLLPRLFSGETLDQQLVRGLAYGGLLLGPSRIAPYHAARGG